MGYTVKKNDTLWDLAGSNNTTVDEILKLNPTITNPDKIYTGQNINLPTNVWKESGAADNPELFKQGYTYEKHRYSPFKESDDLIAAKGNATTANDAYTQWVNNGFTFSQADAHKAATDQYNTWLNNGFSYDFNQDALYQQYKDKYIKQGKMAMQDAMGQAAALTGGYGNSYAATVGNQAYQASLENLNDVIPELYQMAYNMHQDKGANYLNQIGLLDKERAHELGLWNDKAGRLDSDRTYYQSVADSLFNKEYGMWDSDRTYSQTEHHNSENMRYQDYRDAILDDQWLKNYELNDRQVKLDEEKWDYQKKNSSVDEDGGNNPIDPPKEPDGGSPEPYTKDYYADWYAIDWESYFAHIRQSEGQAAAEVELEKFTSGGLIPTNYIAIATSGARGGKLGH